MRIFDVIIIGGSHVGLSAGLVLGRSLRNVLVIDSAEPCNRLSEHVHSFLTQDGQSSAAILQKAKEQVLFYKTVSIFHDKAVQAKEQGNGFSVTVQSGAIFLSKKVIVATGVKDYEVNGKSIGVLGNGEVGFERISLIQNWSTDITLFTNGKSLLTPEQEQYLTRKKIDIIEDEVKTIEHKEGKIKSLFLEGGKKFSLAALFAKVAFEQHSNIPLQMGCEQTEAGFFKADEFGKTNVPGVFAAGETTTPFRTVVTAINAGLKAGIAVNNELTEEDFCNTYQNSE